MPETNAVALFLGRDREVAVLSDALEARLDLAEEQLAHGERDEGRELLVECWTIAHDMGARVSSNEPSASPPAAGSRFRSRRRARGR